MTASESVARLASTAAAVACAAHRCDAEYVDDALLLIRRQAECAHAHIPLHSLARIGLARMINQTKELARSAVDGCDKERLLFRLRLASDCDERTTASNEAGQGALHSGIRSAVHGLIASIVTIVVIKWRRYRSNSSTDNAVCRRKWEGGCLAVQSANLDPAAISGDS